MKNSVEYKGILLMRGSTAYDLYFDKDDKNHKKLDAHMKEVEQRYQELLKRY